MCIRDSPIRLLQFINTPDLILTNAAGGINPEFNAGDIILIKDHINMIPDHPLRGCLLYTSDAADERSSVDLGGRRIIKKKKQTQTHRTRSQQYKNIRCDNDVSQQRITTDTTKRTR